MRSHISGSEINNDPQAGMSMSHYRFYHMQSGMWKVEKTIYSDNERELFIWRIKLIIHSNSLTDVWPQSSNWPTCRVR